METLEFQSEARQLLQLMIHSIYSNKDTFLRELISNASDALDKLRLETFKDKDLVADVSDLHITLETDQRARTLTVRDNGIGMTRDEVVDLIGTIAKSGTADFLRRVGDSAKAQAGETPAYDLIGQFGVGFYSTFMVADKVTLVTRHPQASEGVRWESSGESTYSIGPEPEAPQGTSVTLHLKPVDAEDKLPDYTEAWVLRDIVKRYSDFITWPVRLSSASEEDEETEENDTSEAARESETINSRKALWARPASEVSDAEYTEFYQLISHDWNVPLETVRFQAEGTFEYQALLFIPSQAPPDLYLRERERGLQLYVRRVFVMGQCAELVPEYLRFVKGVVDAADLSLNVSREILQQDRQIQLMRRRLVKKLLQAIKSMMTEKPDTYATFWREFGAALKEGLLNDYENRDAILAACSFASTNSPDALTTLADYVSRMKDDQEHIYYMTGDSRLTVENSPHLEALRAKGFEVLILTDPIDEMWIGSVPEFSGQAFQSAAKGEVDLESEEEKAAHSEREQNFTDFLSWMSTALAEHVKQVRLSSRLTTSPACVVGESYDMTPALEKMYRATGQEVPRVKRTLELNPDHPLVEQLHLAHESGATGLEDAAELIYGMALLAEGGELSDPARFVRLLADRLKPTLRRRPRSRAKEAAAQVS